MKLLAVLAIIGLAVLAGCDSGGGQSCSLDGGTTLAPTTWPSLRADLGNTGRAAVDLTGSRGNGRLLFDGFCSIDTAQTCSMESGCLPEDGTCTRIGPIATTPILDTIDTPQGPPFIYLGSSDGTIYPVTSTGDMLDFEQQMMLTSPIVGSPLLGLDHTLFVAGNSILAQFETNLEVDNTGVLLSVAAVAGLVTASPNIWNGDGTPDGTDGTVFFSTQGGSFTGICPNAVPRWTLVFPGSSSTAALVQDPNFTDQVTPIIVVGGLNGLVRGFSVRGRTTWSFLASADIVAATVIDPSTDLAYVADTAGRLFILDVANGQPMLPLPFTAAAAITASPALGRDSAEVPTLYVADQSGVLYALDRATLSERWRFQAEGPIRSSPAVATMGDRDVIVFGADILGSPNPGDAPVPIGGKVYAIRDDGDRPEVQWTFDVGHAIGSASPSIGVDRTIYNGRQGDRLRPAGECPGAARACVVNEGGALYAIAP